MRRRVKIKHKALFFESCWAVRPPWFQPCPQYQKHLFVTWKADFCSGMVAVFVCAVIQKCYCSWQQWKTAGTGSVNMSCKSGSLITFHYALTDWRCVSFCMECLQYSLSIYLVLKKQMIINHGFSSCGLTEQGFRKKYEKNNHRGNFLLVLVWVRTQLVLPSDFTFQLGVF